MLMIIIVVTTISIFIIYEKNNPNYYKFISIGDGLAHGLNPLGVKSYNYNDYLKEYLENNGKNVKYYNYSEKNLSISELTNDLIYLKDEKLKEYLKTSNLIILSIGEKEIEDNKDFDIIKENLQNLIYEIKKYNNNICLLGRYNTNKDLEEKIVKINDIYKKIAKKNNVIYINIDKNNYYLNNKFNYPSISGYKEISSAIIAAMHLNNY
jgi:lysophospholipase L1-like esterase